MLGNVVLLGICVLMFGYLIAALVVAGEVLT